MKFKTDFPWTFWWWNFSEQDRRKCEFELDKIRTRYTDCSDDLNEINIEEYLGTCSHGIIVVGINSNLRGFALCDRPNGQSSFRTKIIRGDDESIKMMMKLFKIDTRPNCMSEWLLITESDKIDFFKEYGFDICDGIAENGKIQMYNIDVKRKHIPWLGCSLGF